MVVLLEARLRFLRGSRSVPTAASARGAKDFILLIGAGRGRRFVENHVAACRFRFLGGAGGRRDTETPLFR